MKVVSDLNQKSRIELKLFSALGILLITCGYDLLLNSVCFICDSKAADVDLIQIAFAC